MGASDGSIRSVVLTPTLFGQPIRLTGSPHVNVLRPDGVLERCCYKERHTA